MDEAILSEHNKQEFPPMHTAEHILNQTMVRMYGCPRSKNAHIERKKSKCDYLLPQAPSEEQIIVIEQKVNDVIAQHLEVNTSMVDIHEAAKQIDLSKLPESATHADKIRIVTIGDYDACACVGAHVRNTAEIGTFKIISSDYQEGVWRVRFKLENSPYQSTL